jgi:hypothetical protein
VATQAGETIVNGRKEDVCINTHVRV